MAKSYAERCAAKRKALNTLIDKGNEFEKAGARKAKKALCDSWTKRRSKNVHGVYRKANAKPGACIVTKGV